MKCTAGKTVGSSMKFVDLCLEQTQPEAKHSTYFIFSPPTMVGLQALSATKEQSYLSSGVSVSIAGSTRDSRLTRTELAWMHRP